jgi:hypothetical protein
MSQEILIATAFALPFELHLSLDHPFSSGRTIYLDFVGPDRPKESELRAVIERFTRLAETGALGSSVVPPERSSVGPHSVTPTAAAIERCLVDDRGAIVFAHLLLAHQDRLALRSVTVKTATQLEFYSPAENAPAGSTYPDLPETLPFELVDDRQAGSPGATFTAMLVRDCGPDDAQALAAALGAWADAVDGGGYALAPLPPRQCHVETLRPVHAGSRFEYAVTALRAAPEALVGVVNIFTAFHHGCCRLELLRIS